MDFSLLIVLLIVGLVGVIIFKISKRILKAVFGMLFIFIVIVSVFVFFMYQDIDKLRDNLTQEKLYLLSEDGNLINGFTHTPSKDEGLLKNSKGLVFSTVDVNQTKRLDDETLAELDKWYQKKKWDLLLGENSRFFIVDISVFDEVNNLTFAELYVNKDAQSPHFILDEFKFGRATIYPQSSFYKGVKRIPNFIFKRLITTKGKP